MGKCIFLGTREAGKKLEPSKRGCLVVNMHGWGDVVNLWWWCMALKHGEFFVVVDG
jgi:hypothetical protein